MSDEPIFIGGLQRSGTSLVRGIVGSHPDVAIFEWDLQLWTSFFDRFKNRDLQEQEVVTTLLEEIFSNEKVKASHTNIDRHAVEKRIAAHSKLVTCGIVFQCFLEEYASLMGRPRWGLKTPHNEFFAEHIFTAYPNARMVQIIRDPRDVAVSYQNYGHGTWAYSYSPDGHIQKWRQSVDVSIKNAAQYSDRYLCIRYEDLVSAPEKTIRAICIALKLSFIPDMLTMGGHKGWQGSNSSFNDLGRQSKEISPIAIGRYRTQLQPHITYLYQKKLAQPLLQLGYELETYTLSQHVKYSLLVTGDRAVRYTRIVFERAIKLFRQSSLYRPVRAFYRKILKPLVQK